MRRPDRRPLRPAAPRFEPLPAPEAPAEDVAELLERLGKFRSHLEDAVRQVHMLEQAVREADAGELSPGARTYYRIEVQVAQNRVTLWTRQVRVLERTARSLGLKP